MDLQDIPWLAASSRGLKPLDRSSLSTDLAKGHRENSRRTATRTVREEEMNGNPKIKLLALPHILTVLPRINWPVLIFVGFATT